MKAIVSALLLSLAACGAQTYQVTQQPTMPSQDRLGAPAGRSDPVNNLPAGAPLVHLRPVAVDDQALRPVASRPALQAVLCISVAGEAVLFLEPTPL